MIKTLTHEKLLRYVYNELPVDEQTTVEQALLHDPELAARCADLLLAQQALTAVRQEPGAAATQTILQYSRAFLRTS